MSFMVTLHTENFSYRRTSKPFLVDSTSYFGVSSPGGVLLIISSGDNVPTLASFFANVSIEEMSPDSGLLAIFCSSMNSDRRVLRSLF